VGSSPIASTKIPDESLRCRTEIAQDGSSPRDPRALSGPLAASTHLLEPTDVRHPSRRRCHADRRGAGACGCEGKSHGSCPSAAAAAGDTGGLAVAVTLRRSKVRAQLPVGGREALLADDLGLIASAVTSQRGHLAVLFGRGASGDHNLDGAIVAELRLAVQHENLASGELR
jgi:hypothetical protein